MTLGAKAWNDLVEEVIEEWTGRDGLIEFIADALDADGYLPLSEPVTVKQLLELPEDVARQILVGEAKRQITVTSAGDRSVPPDLMRLITDYLTARNDQMEGA